MLMVQGNMHEKNEYSKKGNFEFLIGARNFLTTSTCLIFLNIRQPLIIDIEKRATSNYKD